MKLFVCINYMMVVQNIWQSPSFYQGLPCFLPTSPATALFGWCRHELNIQSMDGVGTHPTHPQTCRALVARSSANFTPQQILSLQIFSTPCQAAKQVGHILTPCFSGSKACGCAQKAEKEVGKNTVDFCPISAKTSFVPLRHSLVCLIHP